MRIWRLVSSIESTSRTMRHPCRGWEFGIGFDADSSAFRSSQNHMASIGIVYAMTYMPSCCMSASGSFQEACSRILYDDSASRACLSRASSVRPRNWSWFKNAFWSVALCVIHSSMSSRWRAPFLIDCLESRMERTQWCPALYKVSAETQESSSKCLYQYSPSQWMGPKRLSLW